MRSEALPAEAEVVTGAVLRVYKFPAYDNMAAASAGHAHHTQLVLHVFTLGDDVTADWSVTRRILKLEIRSLERGICPIYEYIRTDTII